MFHVHSLSDTVTDISVIVGSRFWAAPPDSSHPHGHGRIETLVTFFIGVALASVGLGLGSQAISTIHLHHGASPGWIAFVAACLSILVKEGLYQWTKRVGERIKSTAMVANAWHHRSDALSSVPVAIAVLGSQIYPRWIYLDHIATIIVSILILHASWKIAWPSLRQLTDAGINQGELKEVCKIILETEGVRDCHNIRTRQFGSGLKMDFHILVDSGITVGEGHQISGLVKSRLLEKKAEIVDILIHVEPYSYEPIKNGEG